MNAIWKFPLSPEPEPRGPVVVSMPQGARPLHVDRQGAEPFLWALVNPEAETEERQFLTIRTGEEFDIPSMPTEVAVRNLYMGSYMLFDGAFVGHVFEVLP